MPQRRRSVDRVTEQIKAQAAKLIKRVGPDHPITVQPAGTHVVVKVGDRVIAESDDALLLQEASYPAVLYVPRGDLDESVVRPSATTSYCPYKGDAGYLSIDTGEQQVTDAAWTYERPYEDVAAIAGHVAFYPDRVAIHAG